MPCILLENCNVPGDLDVQIGRFVENYNLCCDRERLKNQTLQTSTSDAAKPSSCKEKGPKARPSGNDDCSTNRKPLYIQPR